LCPFAFKCHVFHVTPYVAILRSWDQINVMVNSVYGHDNPSARKLLIQKLHFISNNCNFKTADEPMLI
jgi:hypothetical protein